MSNLFVYKTAVVPKIDIPGYEGKYYVRDDGTVWRYGAKKDKRLYGHKKGRAREFHLVDSDGVEHTTTMSRIMRKTYFIGISDDEPLMHRNGMEEDWSVWNLEPVSRHDLGKKTYRHNNARSIMKKDPRTFRTVEILSSSREAAKKAGCSHAAILDACNMIRKTHPGIAPDGYLYQWEK